MQIITLTGSKVALSVVQKVLKTYEQMIIRGEQDLARAQIQVEFEKNRQVANLFYEKYQNQMDENVKKIFNEFRER